MTQLSECKYNNIIFLRELLYLFFHFLYRIELQSSKSTNNMGNVFKSQLEIIQKNLEKKTKKRGISQYMDDNDDDDDNSEFSDDEFD